MPNDTFTVDVTLTYAGYSAYGPFYWLETAPGTQNFFRITAHDYFTFTDPDQPTLPNNFDFVMTNGVDTGQFATHYNLGATNNPLTLVPPGTYLITHITFSITRAAPGVYTFYTTSTNPRPSIVTDDQFNDNAIPRASFMITVVPESSTFALLALTGAGVGFARVFAPRRVALRKNARLESDARFQQLHAIGWNSLTSNFDVRMFAKESVTFAWPLW